MSERFDGLRWKFPGSFVVNCVVDDGDCCGRWTYEEYR
jgi:hypothetical protein